MIKEILFYDEKYIVDNLVRLRRMGKSYQQSVKILSNETSQPESFIEHALKNYTKKASVLR